MKSQSLLYLLSTCHLIILVQCVGSGINKNRTSEQVLIVQTVTAGPSKLEDFVTNTTKDYRLTVNIKNTRVRHRKLKYRKPTKRTISKKKELRMLDLSGNMCLKWSPTWNITTNSQIGSILVDYCLSEIIPVPNVYTCVNKTNFTLCTITKKPQCKHNFENLTPGNFTVYIKPLCEKCFAMVMYKRDCVTSVFTRAVILASKELKEKQEISIAATKEPTLMSRDDSHVTIIIAASLSIIFVILLLLIAVIVKRYCIKKSSSAGFTTSIDDASLHELLPMSINQTEVKQIHSQKSSTSALEKETSFTSAEKPTKDSALLTRPQKQGQVTLEQEQQPSDADYQDYLLAHENITQSELDPSAMIVDLCKSCSTSDNLGTSQQICHNDLQATDAAGSLEGACGPLNCDDTVTRNKERPRPLKILFDVPYHLILDHDD